MPSELCRNATEDPEAVVDGAVWLIGHMCQHIGVVSDLGGLDVLDLGCGVRFPQAFLNRGVPMKHYIGVDTSRDVIEFLQSNVSDPRFEYFHVDAHNESYSPTGQLLSDLTVPEIEGSRFDLICLFSVFTHMVPDDYIAMLRPLRRFVKPDGRLFYTLFVKPPDFVDAWAGKGMMCALYARRYAIELIDGTGWGLVRISGPDIHLQHHAVCAPVARGSEPPPTRY